MRVFRPGEDRLRAATTRSCRGSTTRDAERFGAEFDARAGRDRAGAGRLAAVRPRGASSPASRRRCSSARRSTTSACRRCSTRWSISRRRRGARAALQRVVEPDEGRFTGVVFKIQANMDPAHRDRVAFVRVCSGRFERGMRLQGARTGKEVRPNNVVSFLSQRRELVDEAFAGDIIGIPNHGVLQLGDTLDRRREAAVHRPAVLRAGDLPAPSRWPTRCAASSSRPGSRSSARKARSRSSARWRGSLLLGAVGQLQFEVVAHRLEHEYGVKARMLPSRFSLARWVTAGRGARRSWSASSTPTPIASRTTWSMRRRCSWPRARAAGLEEIWPKIRFHALREHAGLVFQQRLSA